VTVKLLRLPIFLRNYRDSYTGVLKEYYNLSPISTSTDRSPYFGETIVTVRM
jgi:hypothetical protein